MFRVYCIELAKENQDKADKILHKYYVNSDIDVKYMMQSCRSGMTTVQYWLTCVCEDDLEAIANELNADGIELF